jgi:hypothetical protein
VGESETVSVAGVVPEDGVTDNQFVLLDAVAVNGTAPPPDPVT